MKKRLLALAVFGGLVVSCGGNGGNSNPIAEAPTPEPAPQPQPQPEPEPQPEPAPTFAEVLPQFFSESFVNWVIATSKEVKGLANQKEEQVQDYGVYSISPAGYYFTFGTNPSAKTRPSELFYLNFVVVSPDDDGNKLFSPVFYPDGSVKAFYSNSGQKLADKSFEWAEVKVCTSSGCTAIDGKIKIPMAIAGTQQINVRTDDGSHLYVKREGTSHTMLWLSPKGYGHLEQQEYDIDNPDKGLAIKTPITIKYTEEGSDLKNKKVCFEFWEFNYVDGLIDGSKITRHNLKGVRCYNF